MPIAQAKVPQTPDSATVADAENTQSTDSSVYAPVRSYGSRLTPKSVLALQSQIGNQAVRARLQRDEPTSPTAAPRWQPADQAMLDAAVARVGIIEAFQARRVPAAVAALSSNASYQMFRGLLTGAGSDTERAFICKALVARHSNIAEVFTFAAQIQGRGDAWLLGNLNVAHVLTNPSSPSAGGGIQQHYHMSCSATSAELLRATYDPIYALDLRTRGVVPPPGAEGDSNEMALDNEQTLAEQQRLLLRFGSLGGGVNADGISSIMNSASASTGLRYHTQRVPVPFSVESLISLLQTRLTDGILIPVGVVFPDSGGAHHVIMFIGRSGNRFQYHDPDGGRTGWVSQSAVFNDNIRLYGQQCMIDAVAVPRPISGG